MPNPPLLYVSITGLKPHSRWHALRFWRYAVPAMIEAKRAPGCLSVSTRTIGGIKHTLSVWESEAAMRRYLYAGAHREAIRRLPDIGTGLTFGYLTSRVPAWSEVHALWRERGKPYRGAGAPALDDADQKIAGSQRPCSG